MTNNIPTKSRLLVRSRDSGHCCRCGGQGNEWHHRRRKRVLDEHTHLPCNGITLCTVCHAWVHAHPTVSKGMGWIVSAHDNPHDHPVHTFMYGWALLSHDGTIELQHECIECERVTYTEAGLCMSCLRGLVCCPNAVVAAASGCGCKGAAAVSLLKLIERAGERDG